MKKGIRGHDVAESGLKKIDSICAKTGIEYIQLVLEKSIVDFKAGEYSQEYAQKIKSEMPNTKIAILGSYINPSDPNEEALRESIEKFKEKIRYATVLNPIAVGTETGSYIEGKTHTEEAYQYLLKTVKELVAEAEKYNVNIAIEGVYTFVINSPGIMSRLVNDVNSENIKVIFDPGNLITIENFSAQDKIINDMFDLLADRIVAIHAKDFVIEGKDKVRVGVCEGAINYKLIFEKMKEYNLDIPVIFEGYTPEEAKEAFLKLEMLNKVM